MAPMTPEPKHLQSIEPWPELPRTEWKSTLDTQHMWLQIAVKVRMALSPPLNHFWHTTL
jgi:hypothetical protein